MSWIIAEGLDRVGKSTVAEIYKKQGYKIIHMSAPDKKHFNPDYCGPSYLDEILETYMKLDGQDIFWDRSVYGELVWPFVYGRDQKLDDDAIEVLREFEDRNQTKYILMYDQNVEAHWKRCVENKEPLTKNKFNQAIALFERIAQKYAFERKQLPDFVNDKKVEHEPKVEQSSVEVQLTSEKPTVAIQELKLKNAKSSEQIKLEKANAINSILSNRIIKRKGDIFDSIERDIRDFLNLKLGAIFGTSDIAGKFTNEELQVLKIFCQRSLNKAKTEENK